MSTALASPPPADDRPGTGPAPSRWADVAAFVGGGLAAALGIAVAELMAGLAAGAPSLVIAIGDLVIENQPPGAKELMVELFGTNDKLALNVAIVLATLLVAGLLGVAGRRRWGIPVAGFVVAGAVGLVAALAQSADGPAAWPSSPSSSPSARRSSRCARCCVPPAQPGQAQPGETPRAAAAAADARLGSATLPADRWRCGRRVARARPRRSRASSTTARVAPSRAPRCPAAAGPVPEVPAAASLDVEGITPIVTPNDSFYRIDTALVTPRVDVADWQLTVKGLVDREVMLTLRAALGAAALRAVRDHRLRLQRGRRPARRQRPVDGRGPARGARHGRRAARGDADRGPLRGRLHGRLPDGLGHGPRAPPDDRAGHERRAVARSTTATRPGSSSPACTAT